MSEIISTDGNAVQEFKTSILNASQNVSFNPTGKINTSTSPATDELKSLISNFQESIELYKSCVAMDVKNVEALHLAMQSTDESWSNSFNESRDTLNG